MMKSVVLGLCVPVSFALVAASGCSSTTNNTYADGGAPLPGTDGSMLAMDGGDGGTNGTGVLGFHPSNLGDLLEGLDLSPLVDIDVTTVGSYVSLACGVQANNGCLEKTITQSDGSTVTVYIAKSWKIETTVDMGDRDETPTILVATDTIVVLGKISASADTLSARAGGYSGGGGALQGAGPGGGGGPNGASGNLTGGGGGGHCGAGGNGGKAAGTFGIAGRTYGNAAIIPLQGGSAGGVSLSGGGGGGLQLVAGQSITIAAGAAVSAGGGGSGSIVSGGGGGGAVLLEAPVVTIAGTVAANGGGGGQGSGGRAPGDNATPTSIAALGGGNGTIGAGGNGAAAAAIAGGDGAIGDNDVTYGPAGGGGGAGWIRINTRTGSAAISGALSPAATTSCATQGTLN